MRTTETESPPRVQDREAALRKQGFRPGFPPHIAPMARAVDLSVPKMLLWQTCSYLCDLSVGELSPPKVRGSFQAVNMIVTRSIGLALNGPFRVEPAGR
jgi:hypothetical protein